MAEKVVGFVDYSADTAADKEIERLGSWLIINVLPLLRSLLVVIRRLRIRVHAGPGSFLRTGGGPGTLTLYTKAVRKAIFWVHA